MAASRAGEVGRLAKSFAADYASLKFRFDDDLLGPVETRRFFTRRTIEVIRGFEILCKRFEDWQASGRPVETAANEFINAFSQWDNMATYLLDRLEGIGRKGFFPTHTGKAGILRNSVTRAKRIIAGLAPAAETRVPKGVSEFLNELHANRGPADLEELRNLASCVIEKLDAEDRPGTDEWAGTLAEDLAKFKD